MFEAAVNAFLSMFEVGRLGLLVSGVLLGLIIGIIPGIGGLFGLSILLPFTFTMDLNDALTLMLSMLSVTVTGDTISCVLLGVPGTAGSIATVLDGHPLAKQGQAARALGASYIASMIGGLFGALLLVASLPIMKFFILLFGSPEVLMLSVFGLTMVGTLSGRVPRRGIAAAALGVLVATVGRSPYTGDLRYTLGQVYLWDGIPLVPVALGLYAFPEILSLALTKKSISAIALPPFRELLRGQLEGAKDALRNWFLILRCSSLGAWIGFVPGLGGSIADWFAYAHAKQTCKNSETFGTGDIRGVIASECSNNACTGGALIPTIGFGIPGSPGMAILIGAMIIAGLQPGRVMLTQRVDITFTLIWTLALANILGAGICFGLTSQLARIVHFPYYVILALIIPLLFLASYVSTCVFQDIVVFLAFGGLGYLMKMFGWPRPPLIVGFILGEIIELNLVTSVALMGWRWLTRPAVLIIILLIIATLLYESVLRRREKKNMPC